MLLRNQVYVTKMSPNITNLAKEIEIAMETTFPPLVGVWKCLLGIQVLERPLQVLVSFGSHNCDVFPCWSLLLWLPPINDFYIHYQHF